MFRNWLFLTLVFLIVPVVSGHEYLAASLSTDNTGICKFIMILFFLALYKNFTQVANLAQEMEYVENFAKEKKATYPTGENYLSKHFLSLQTIKTKCPQKELDQSNLLEILNGRITGDGFFVALISNILITLGLIGTIVGLVVTTSGMNELLETRVGANAELMESMKTALSGVGIAFYTTLVGAVFGGIGLRILNAFTENEVGTLVGKIAEITETHLIPSLEGNQGSKPKFEQDHERVALDDVKKIHDLQVKFLNEIHENGFKPIVLALAEMKAIIEKANVELKETVDLIALKSLSEKVHTNMNEIVQIIEKKKV